jgi:hypothetical protein
MHLWKRDRRFIASIPCFQRYDSHHGLLMLVTCCLG